MSVKTVQAIINGVTTTLTYNSDNGKYEATITAPVKSSYTVNDGHYYPVTVTAEDDAGNITTVDDTHTTLGESLKLKVLEKVAPVISITSPTASAFITDSMSPIVFTVTDDDSGVDTSTISLTLDGTTVVDSADIQMEETAGGYTCTYTPEVAWDDGEHTISVGASDNDGNAATAASVTFTVDTVPPTLSVTAPTDGLVVNVADLVVSGTTDDATSGNVIVTVNGEEATVGEDGAFSKTVTLTSGQNLITVIATDAAGKTTTVTRTVTLDTGAPVIHSVTLTPNPADAGKTYIISVEVTD